MTLRTAELRRRGLRLKGGGGVYVFVAHGIIALSDLYIFGVRLVLGCRWSE